MPNFYSEDDLTCFCQGPGPGCSFCTPESDETQLDPFIYNSDDQNTISRESSGTYEIKAKWLQTTTPDAVLFVTKKGCLWIPLAMITSIDKTKKGKYKIKVFDSFEPKYLEKSNHTFFGKL